MKKGDIIGRTYKIEEGENLATGFESEVSASDWVKHNKERGVPKLQSNGEWNVVASTSYFKEQRAKVQWVVGDEASVNMGNDAYKILDLKVALDWKVVEEAPPSFQSNVAQMTDEQLRESIEALRNKRVGLPKPRAYKVKAPVVDKSDPIAQALAKLSPTEKLALKRKLGLVE